MNGAPTEHAEAAMLIRACRAAEATHPELRLLYAIPNGGHRARRTAAQMKAEGVKAGVPDYHLPVARGGHIGLWVELKRTNGGRLQPEQRAWLDALERQGHRVVVARGWEEAFGAIRNYLTDDGHDDEVM